jgi:uncharacterized protein (TIGR02246 family)
MIGYAYGSAINKTMRVQSNLLPLALALPLYIGFARPALASDDSDVRAVVAREIEGWSKFDAREVASVYTSDAIWQNPFGVRLHGSSELEKFLDGLFQRPGYRSAKDTSAPKILDLRFPTPDVAIVWSDESSAGQIDDATGQPMHPRHSYYLEVLVRKNGVWKISDSLIMDELPAAHQ